MTQVVSVDSRVEIGIRTAQTILGDFELLTPSVPVVQERSVTPAIRPRRPKHATRGSWESEVDAFVKAWQQRRCIGERWAKGLRYTLGRIPKLLSKAGVAPAVSRSSQISEEHVTALRTQMGWEKATTEFYFAGLRQFLRWRANPVADRPEVWRLPSSTSQRRRWITREQLAALFGASSGPARLIVALEGFNGLRRVEVLRLRVMDVNVAEGWLNVRGKGRMGGKWRQIPLSDIARAELQAHIAGIRPEDRVLPYSASWADNQVAKAVQAAGFPKLGVKVSHHDLRRTFGRVAHDSGMDLIQLKNLFGHSSLEMTVHYVGLDLQRMREGLSRVDRSFEPLVDKESCTVAGGLNSSKH